MSVGADIANIMRELLARAPQWIRTDLSSKDATTRSMIAAALNKDGI